jgi:hypothetical protein
MWQYSKVNAPLVPRYRKFAYKGDTAIRKWFGLKPGKEYNVPDRAISRIEDLGEYAAEPKHVGFAKPWVDKTHQVREAMSYTTRGRRLQLVGGSIRSSNSLSTRRRRPAKRARVPSSVVTSSGRRISRAKYLPAIRRRLVSRAPPRLLARRYFTQGRMGRRFSRKRLRTAYTGNYISKGAVIKSDTGNVFGDAECVYVGHGTHPARLVIRSLCMALVRMFAQRAKQDFNDWSEVIGGADDFLINDAGFSFRFTYKTDPTGTLQESTQIDINSADKSYYTLAEEIANDIVNLVTASTVHFEIVDMYFYRVGSTEIGDMQFGKPIIFRAKDLKVQVHGTSNLSIQNRTQAQATTGDMHDVENNPLRGKHYWGYGSYFPMKYFDDRTSNSDGLFMYHKDGTLVLGAADSDLTTGMQEALRKPPPGKAFGGVKKTAYVRIMPGHIRDSKLSNTVTKYWNGWMKALLAHMRTGDDITTNDSKDPVPATGIRDKFDTKIGQCSFFGLEKVCESTAGETEISIGYNLKLTLSSRAIYRQKLYCNPKVIIGTANEN